ncbi:MAG: acylphosphatase [Candidatus Omnitrophica bacterium]|nr:acylphosphatase [Candidatus Omnitrophota bacterium]
MKTEKTKKKTLKKNFSRAHLFYSGRVQGVGFRFTAERLALELGLVGWVKNLPDRRVELVCEGEREDVEALLRRIRESSLGASIAKTVCEWESATGEFSDFSIEYCL